MFQKKAKKKPENYLRLLLELRGVEPRSMSVYLVTIYARIPL